jgi:hypothetical protein
MIAEVEKILAAPLMTPQEMPDLVAAIRLMAAAVEVLQAAPQAKLAGAPKTFPSLVTT